MLLVRLLGAFRSCCRFRMLLGVFLLGPRSPRIMKTCPKHCRVVQKSRFREICIVSVMDCFWVPHGTKFDFLFKLFTHMGTSWSCLVVTSATADWDKLMFFLAMDSRGRLLMRNGAPGHPKARQNDFKMVPRGSKIVTLFVSSVWFAWFFALGAHFFCFSVCLQLFWWR